MIRYEMRDTSTDDKAPNNEWPTIVEFDDWRMVKGQ